MVSSIIGRFPSTISLKDSRDCFELSFFVPIELFRPQVFAYYLWITKTYVQAIRPKFIHIRNYPDT